MLAAIDWFEVYRWAPTAVGFMLPLIAASDGLGSKLKWFGCAPVFALLLFCCIPLLLFVVNLYGGEPRSGWSVEGEILHCAIGGIIGIIPGLFFAGSFARR